uniref:Uncharacterized protein n=1 Tax=Panagrellus redivivus TaxID=6233 RepID=A0A7E4V9Y9_PANRE
MLSRWFLVFGWFIVLFSMHAYCKFGPTEWETPGANPDFSEFDNAVAKDKAKFEKESSDMHKSHKDNADKIEKAAKTALILAIVLPIVGCLLLLLCCGVTIGLTVWCVCKKKKGK